MYSLLLREFGERELRYDTDVFQNYFINNLENYIPKLFTAQQVFIKNELNILADKLNRGNSADRTSDASTSTNQGFSTGPYDMTIGTIATDDLAKVKERIRTLGDRKLTDQLNNIDFLNNAARVLNSSFKAQIDIFFSDIERAGLFAKYDQAIESEQSVTPDEVLDAMFKLLSDFFKDSNTITISKDGVTRTFE
ncbi:MAG: hypothetical protein ACRCXT_01605 [Paraclostridium sp.]